MKLKTIIIALLCCLILSAFNISACKSNSDESDSNSHYNVEFYIDGNKAGNQPVSEAAANSYVIKPNFGVLERSKDVFDGWYIDRQFTQKFNFSNRITSDLNLYARNLTYYDALKILVGNEGKSVTSSQVEITGTDGKAIKINGCTGDNHGDAYLDLATADGSLAVYESNKKNTNYWYLFVWQLDTGNGSYYVCDTSMMIYFRATFNKEYEFNLSVNDNDITEYKNNNWGYNTNTGLMGLKSTITNISRSIDSLIVKNYVVT